jgi:hypothetical protein
MIGSNGINKRNMSQIDKDEKGKNNDTDAFKYRDKNSYNQS